MAENDHYPPIINIPAIDEPCPNCGKVAIDPKYREIWSPEEFEERKKSLYRLVGQTHCCPFCGYDYSTGKTPAQKKEIKEEKCQICGGKIVVDPATGKKVCAECGAEYVKQEGTVNETDKKCPNCGATITFDPALGKLHCDYCGYSCELPATDNNNEVREIDFESAVNTESYEWGMEKKSVACKSCGAVTIYDALETAAVCPFCGSTQVMPAATENTIAPGGVCPFTVTKDEAGKSFTKWLHRKLFTPKKAKQNANPEAFHGVYLPYWTYDAQTTSDFRASAGYDRQVKNKDGSTSTETTWRSVRGVYQEFIDDETVMASKRQENSGVKDCEPFQLSKVIPYDPKVLAGFVAERYSIGLKEGWEIAQTSIHKKLKSSIDDYVKHHWDCDHVRNVSFSTIYSDITYKYILVPVWISSFKYKEKTYQFAVNGQTGKVGGKAPVSGWRVLIAVLIGLGIIAGLYYFLT